MTFLGLEARTDLPKVPYPTALDFFVFLSFGFIFATIIQFAFVHYFTKYGSGECYFSVDDRSSESESDDDDFNDINKRTIQSDSSTSSANCRSGSTHRIEINNGNRIFEVIPLSVCSIPVTPFKESNPKTVCFLPCLTKSTERLTAHETPVVSSKKTFSFYFMINLILQFIC